MLSSRTLFLEDCLSKSGFDRAIKAFDLVIREMCSERGFSRHDGSHYYHHLVDVTQIIYNFGIRDEDILIAALFHDLVEDVFIDEVKKIPKYGLFWISENYGQRVADMVDLVTKKPDLNYKDPEVMKAYLDAISKNFGAALIKTADRVHNFGTLDDATFEKQLKQADETQTFFFEFFKLCRNGYPRISEFFYFAKTSIEPHLKSIRARQSEREQWQREKTQMQAEIENLVKQIEAFKGTA